MERVLLKPAEAAEMLGLGRSKTYQMMKAGEIPCVRIGKSVRVPVAGLREWIRTRVEVGKAEHAIIHTR
jgi:excisionase family DNA binding protein